MAAILYHGHSHEGLEEYHEILKQNEKEILTAQMKEFGTENIFYKIVYTHYKDINWLTQAYFPIFIVRIYIYYLIMLYDQTSSLPSFYYNRSLYSSVCINHLRFPFKYRFQLVQFYTHEAVTLVTDLGAFILVSSDTAGATATSIKEKIV